MGDRVPQRLLALIRRLGNPLRTEAAAFRWLLAIVAVLLALWILLLLVRAVF